MTNRHKSELINVGYGSGLGRVGGLLGVRQGFSDGSFLVPGSIILPVSPI